MFLEHSLAVTSWIWPARNYGHLRSSFPTCHTKYPSGNLCFLFLPSCSPRISHRLTCLRPLFSTVISWMPLLSTCSGAPAYWTWMSRHSSISASWQRAQPVVLGAWPYCDLSVWTAGWPSSDLERWIIAKGRGSIIERMTLRRDKRFCFQWPDRLNCRPSKGHRPVRTKRA